MARSRSRRLAKMLANLRVPRLIRQPAILRLQSWMPATQWSSQRASGSGATIADGLVSSYFDGNADVALWDYPAGGSPIKVITGKSDLPTGAIVSIAKKR